jgi:hypothetical protein
MSKKAKMNVTDQLKIIEQILEILPPPKKKGKTVLTLKIKPDK